MPSVKDLIELMSTTWPVALGLLFASLGVLTADHYALSYLASLPSWLPGAAFIAAILSGSVLAVSIVRETIRLLRAPFVRRRQLRAQEEHIEGLNGISPPEQWLLAWAVANRTQVFAGDYFNDQVKGLLARGYLEIAYGGSHYTKQTPLRIPSHIWTALTRDLANEDLRHLVDVRPFDRY